MAWASGLCLFSAPCFKASAVTSPREPRLARQLLTERLVISPREAEVLWWVMHEKSNNEIGAVLGVSPATVKTHVQNLFKRLDRHTRAGLAVRGTLALLLRDGELPPVECGPAPVAVGKR